MSSPSFKPLASWIPPVAGANASLSKASRVTMTNRPAHPPLEVKGKEKSMLQESLSATSRREMLQLTAASMGLLSLLLPASAEAAPRNATMRQKILQKLKQLREKVGLSKPEDEAEENKPEAEREASPKSKDENQAKPKVHTGAKETKPEAKEEKKHTSKAEEELKVAPSEGAVVPALPGLINVKSVDITLP